jgi:hypothetical protein
MKYWSSSPMIGKGRPGEGRDLEYVRDSRSGDGKCMTEDGRAMTIRTWLAILENEFAAYSLYPSVLFCFVIETFGALKVSIPPYM